jgi:hypothetical protein
MSERCPRQIRVRPGGLEPFMVAATALGLSRGLPLTARFPDTACEWRRRRVVGFAIANTVSEARGFGSGKWTRARFSKWMPRFSISKNFSQATRATGRHCTAWRVRVEGAWLAQTGRLPGHCRIAPVMPAGGKAGKPTRY